MSCLPLSFFRGLHDAQSFVLVEVGRHISTNSQVKTMLKNKEKQRIKKKDSNISVAPKRHEESTNWNGF